jgi:hypothetical protein
MNTRINIHGAIAIGLVVLMVLIQVVQPNNATTLDRILGSVLNFYSLITIIPYVITVFVLTQRQQSKRFTQRYRTADQQFNWFRYLIAAHIAFVLIIVGLFLGLPNIFVQLIYVIVAIAAGLGLMFLLVARQPTENEKES